MKTLFALCFVFIFSFVGLTYAQERQLTLENPTSEQRVALVIGNSAYEVSPLKNPVNDARDVAQTLTALGFQVIHKENLNQVEMKRVIRDFGEKIKNGGVGLFYFAGHGVQVNGANYLIPVGAVIEKQQEVEYEAVDVGFVLAQMENAKTRMNIVILDACRNNPFARSFRSESNGLASINAPSGTLIAYATAPGSVASDGDGKNGLFTQELLFNMRTIGLGVEDVFKRARSSVREKTQGKQTPWESSSLVGDFYFTRADQAKQSPNTQITIPSVDSSAFELSYWDSIKNSSNVEDFRAYLKSYPDGRFAALAKNRITSFEVSSKPVEISSSKNANDSAILSKYDFYLLHKNNKFRDEVKAKLLNLGARSVNFGVKKQRYNQIYDEDLNKIILQVYQDITGMKPNAALIYKDNKKVVIYFGLD